MLIGEIYRTSQQVIDALKNGKVQGVLLEINEVSNLQDYLTTNELKISQLIKSGSGFGIVLAGDLAGMHPEIRSYVETNSAHINQLTKNYTKAIEVSLRSSGGKI